MYPTGISENTFDSFIQNLPKECKTEPQEVYGAKYYINGTLIAEYGYGHGQSFFLIYEEDLIAELLPNRAFHGTLNCFWDPKRQHTVVERERGAHLQLHFHKDGTFKRVLYRNHNTRFDWTEGAIYHRSALSLLADYKKWIAQ